MKTVGRPTAIPWAAIQEAATNEMLDVAELATRFEIKPGTIRKRAERGLLVLVSKLIPKAQMKIAKQAAEKAANDWLAKGEQHREVAFDLAHESLKKMKPTAPRNFREAEAADKIARRAAGLDVADVVSQTLISINEAMEAADEPRPIEAEIVDEPAAALSGPNEETPAPQTALPSAPPEPAQLPATTEAS